jgi:hypothetical protein
MNDLNVLPWPAKPCFFDLSVLLILGHRVYVDTPNYAFPPPEFGEPRETFLGIRLLQESLPDCHSKFSLCVTVSRERYFKIINSALHHHPHSVLHLTRTQQQLLNFNPRVVIGFVNINS